jgi:polysaccharide deacetylase family protein (PEP-CTERM system associated)
LLGLTTRCYPALVAEIPRRGHEVACHGDAHRPVCGQSPGEFRSDLEAARQVIEDVTGRAVVGYRAPLFSIDRSSLWAYDVLCERGFRYDASQYDSPRIPNRVGMIPASPYQLQLASGKTLWEFPVAVARIGSLRLPVGGGSYWRVVPRPMLLRALRVLAATGGYASLYFHPYEWDPEPLRAILPASASVHQHALAMQRSLWRNTGRTRVPALLRAVAAEFRLVTCEQAYTDLEDGGEGRRSLSETGCVV